MYLAILGKSLPMWSQVKDATKCSITTLGIKTLSKMGLFATLSINDIQHNALSVIMLSVTNTLMSVERRYAECRYAECYGAFRLNIRLR